MEEKKTEERPRELIYKTYGVAKVECYLSESSEQYFKISIDITLQDVPSLLLRPQESEKLVNGYIRDALNIVKRFETANGLVRH